jgi:hypothetical protein
MTAQRKRRVRPIKKSVPQTRKKRSIKPSFKEIRWGSLVLKSLTLVVLLLNLFLMFFIVRRCTSVPVQGPGEITPPVEEEIPQVLRIEVLNGCGVPRLAARYTDFLRARGYDVVKTDNYESHNVEHTVVIDRQGNRAACNQLARDLGLGSDQILQEINAIYLIDATVILGKDFRSLDSWKNLEQNGESS